MNTLRSITGLFAMASLFAFAAGCSVSEKEELIGQSKQSLAEPPCECPTVVASSSNIVAPPCECEPPPEEPPVEEPPVEEPPSSCPPGEHEECSVMAPGGVQSIIAPPECVCVPDDEPPCPPGEHEECSVMAPGGVQSIIAPPECVCVPDDEPPCPPHAVPVTTCGGIIAPTGASQIWGGGSGCSTQCVLPY
ncbi:hypothetical protein [Polyangium jinanense]|uniref:Uncharacterized protein n=1 Tax=Polyangium jinanense TaxID=2829994 RepID=A0A9X3X591_9BACT|nr:hypothetical protein [Polyangium jinanense]MDC3959108.1 hypothetical protein [Polyangium jinanense]MDC3983969.1 hypothetical protein [Polyangium jinanense]